MSRGAQVHVFWGAPVGPLKMTISQEATSLMPTAEPWQEMQLPQHCEKDENLAHESGGHAQVPAELPDGPVLVNPVNRSIPEKDEFTHSHSEAGSAKSVKIHLSELNDVTNPKVQTHGFQQFTEGGKYSEPQQENKKITSELPTNQACMSGRGFQTDDLRLNPESAAMSCVPFSAQPVAMGPGTVETQQEPTAHYDDVQTPCQVVEPEPGGAVQTRSEQHVSAATEFLSVMTSSQLVFLALRKDEGQTSVTSVTVNMEIEPETRPGGVRQTADQESQSSANSAEGSGNGQSQAHSLELFSPMCADARSSLIDLNSKKALVENIGSQELFSSEEKPLPSEVGIELCGSGILCSQRITSCRSAAQGTQAPKDRAAPSDAPRAPKKRKLASPTASCAVAVGQRTALVSKGVKKTSLIKSCDSKSHKYNCLVMVLAPCHLKEVSIKSGPNAGSKVPLATIVVTDQSEATRKVSLWRTAAFWALTVFLGDVILLTDVTIHEDRWAAETVLQSTFTSQLLNLGTYSSVQPEEYSNVVSDVVLRDLLAYVSTKHPYLRDLPHRRPQKVNSIEFVELEQLQSDTLVHAVVKVVDITVLTEASYSYRGQTQRKVVLTVEQTRGQQYMLVLWGPGAAWYPQLQRKKDCIWEFKYLFVQRNCVLESLELHTTPWSSCECLFDDDVRAITFKEKFQKRTPSFLKLSDLATQLQDKRSGVSLIKARVLELVFPGAAAETVTLNALTSLHRVFSCLPRITYTGCAKCALALERDENKIYKQCFNCLPCTMKKVYYRPALMTVVDGNCKVHVHVGSELMEKMLLNISPDCLDRVIVPSSEITYGMVAADLLHSLLAASGEPCVLKIQSLFVLDENSFPLQQDFSLLDFHPGSTMPGTSALPEASRTHGGPSRRTR